MSLETSTGAVDLHHEPTRREVEARLRAIPQVIAARLVPGYDRPVDEIHVVVTPGQSPKTAVRDVSTLLMAEFDLAIDHRVVSVVQIADEFVSEGEARVYLRRVAVTHEAAAAEVAVTVEDGQGTSGEGRAVVPAGQGSTAVAAADATLQALQPWLADQRVSLLQANVLQVDDERVCLVVVTLSTPRGTTSVTGSAIIRRDEADATARAVMSSLNRSLDTPT